MAQKRVTIKEISEAAGVSPTTVVKALSGKPKVSEAVRSRVLEIAKKMDYRPNLSARALSGNGFRIGIVTTEKPKPFCEPLRKGMQQQIDALKDYKIEGIYSTFDDHNATEDNIQAIRDVVEKGVDGMIVAIGFNRKPVAEYVRKIYEEKHIPAVFLSQAGDDETGVALIQFDPEAVGRMAEELLELILPKGSNVALITTNKDFLAHQRIISAFRERAEENQKIHLSAVMENQDKEEITYGITELILKTVPDVRGIYISSSNSVPVCECLKDHGLAGEVAVIGHDVFPEMIHYLNDGSLTASIFLNPAEKGRMAVRAMFDYLNHTGGELGEVLTKPELVMRSNLSYYCD